MINLLLCIFLFLIPIPCWGGFGDGIRYPKEAISFLFLLIIGVLGMTSYSMKPFKLKSLPFFIIWIYILSLFINSYSIQMSFAPNVAVPMSVTLFAWKVMFYILVSIFAIYVISSYNSPERNIKLFNLNIDDSEINIDHISKSITWIVIILSSYAILQRFGFDEIFRVADPNTGWIAQNPFLGVKEQEGNLSHRVVATIGNPTLLSAWLGMCIPFCLHSKSKLGVILSSIAIFLTKGSAGILAAVIGGMFFIYYKSKRVFLLLLILLIASGAYMYQFHQGYFNPEGRIEVHKEAFKLYAEKPMFGMGLGTFEYLIGKNQTARNDLNGNSWMELHDEPGELLFMTGWTGFGIIMVFLFGLLRKFKANDNNIVLMASFLAFLVTSPIHFGLHVAPQNFYVIIITALLIRRIDG